MQKLIESPVVAGSARMKYPRFMTHIKGFNERDETMLIRSLYTLTTVQIRLGEGQEKESSQTIKHPSILALNT